MGGVRRWLCADENIYLNKIWLFVFNKKKFIINSIDYHKLIIIIIIIKISS